MSPTLIWDKSFAPEIIPVLNKIDSIDADKESAKKQIFNLIGSSQDEIFEISAKTGNGVSELLKAIPELVNPPVQKTKHANALIFDSFFDSYRGVVASVRVFGDEINMNQKLKLVNSRYTFEPTEMGYFDLKFNPSEKLSSGEVGYIITCLLYTSPSPRDGLLSRMPSSA